MFDPTLPPRRPRGRLIDLGKAASVGLALALLGGCAQLPSGDGRVTLKEPDQFPTRQTLAGLDASWPQEAWWRAYGDRQLDALIDEGLTGSPSMAIAEARLRRTLAMSQIADAAQQPTLSASANPTLQKQSYNYLFPRTAVPQGWNDYGLATLNFNWEIDFWGKHRAGIAAATSMQKASTADAAQARLVLTTSIAYAYAELARLHDTKDVALASIGVRSKTLELLQRRHQHGMENLGNVKQAEARRAASGQELLMAEEQLALQRNRLATLLGSGPDRGLSIARPHIGGNTTIGVPSKLPLELLGRRPDIVAARWRVEAAEKGIDRQQAEFYPNVNMSAMIGLQTLGLNMLTKSGSDFGSVGPAISLPIFSGGRLRAQLRGAQAERDEAIGNYHLAVTHALQEVADAITSQKSLAQQLAKMDQAVAAARDAHRIMKNRYEGGLANYLDVLGTEEILLSSVRILQDMRSRAITIDVTLVKALGGGYLSPDSPNPPKSLQHKKEAK